MKKSTLQQLYQSLKKASSLWETLSVSEAVFTIDPMLEEPVNQALRCALLLDGARLGLIGNLDTLGFGGGLIWPQLPTTRNLMTDCGKVWRDGKTYSECGIRRNKELVSETGSTLKIPKNAQESQQCWHWHDHATQADYLVLNETAYASCSNTFTAKPNLRFQSVDCAEPGSDCNFLIEGDNLDALELLQKSHVEKIDVIYIDPPYNTGNKGFRYVDSFAEGGVNGIHPKWLSFMRARLSLARRLLKQDGSIFISIDDHEYATLKLLCDDIFGHANHVQTIVWKKRNTPPNDKILGCVHEYILIYAKDVQALHLDRKPRSELQVAKYKNPDNHPKGPWVAGDLTANVKGGRFVEHLHYAIINPETGQIHYPGSNGNWRFNAARMNELLTKDEIYFGKDGKGKPKLKRFLADVKDGVAHSTWWDAAGFNGDATKELQAYFLDALAFDTPKPTELIRNILEMTCLSKPDALVMDFFAGSGTTGEALMQLNQMDKGNRRFILVTNNENEICTKVCYPRLKNAAQKYQNVPQLTYQKIVYTLS